MNDSTNQNTHDQNSPASDENGRLPLGLMMALAQNMNALQDYAKLSDAGRARLIDQASHTHSRREMQALIQNINQFL